MTHRKPPAYWRRQVRRGVIPADDPRAQPPETPETGPPSPGGRSLELRIRAARAATPNARTRHR